jgi:hypothetical protein
VRGRDDLLQIRHFLDDLIQLRLYACHLAAIRLSFYATSTLHGSRVILETAEFIGSLPAGVHTAVGFKDERLLVGLI